jgi:hypothetical protein
MQGEGEWRGGVHFLPLPLPPHPRPSSDAIVNISVRTTIEIQYPGSPGGRALARGLPGAVPFFACMWVS